MSDRKIQTRAREARWACTQCGKEAHIGCDFCSVCKFCSEHCKDEGMAEHKKDCNNAARINACTSALLVGLFRRMAQGLKTLVEAPEYEPGDSIWIKELTLRELQEKSNGAPFTLAELKELGFEFISVDPKATAPFAATILNYKVKPNNIACTGLLQADGSSVCHQYVLQIPLP